jgi:hypothetical protein
MGAEGEGVGGRIVGHGAHTWPTYCRQFERSSPTATRCGGKIVGRPVNVGPGLWVSRL